MVVGGVTDGCGNNNGNNDNNINQNSGFGCGNSSLVFLNIFTPFFAYWCGTN